MMRNTGMKTHRSSSYAGGQHDAQPFDEAHPEEARYDRPRDAPHAAHYDDDEEVYRLK